MFVLGSSHSPPAARARPWRPTHISYVSLAHRKVKPQNIRFNNLFLFLSRGKKFSHFIIRYSRRSRIESLRLQITLMPNYHIEQPNRPVLERTGSCPDGGYKTRLQRGRGGRRERGPVEGKLLQCLAWLRQERW